MGSRAGGFDANGCAVLVALDEQSPDISQGVNEADDQNDDLENNIGLVPRNNVWLCMR